MPFYAQDLSPCFPMDLFNAILVKTCRGHQESQASKVKSNSCKAEDPQFQELMTQHQGIDQTKNIRRSQLPSKNAKKRHILHNACGKR